MNKQDYISLITKGLTNEINLSESETLAQLRSSNQDFSSTYDDMQEIWNASGSYVPNVTFDSSSAFDKFAAKYKIPTDSTTKSSKFDYKLVLISVVIALLVSSSLFFYFNNGASNAFKLNTTFENNTAQIESYDYKGGTITLSPGATISLDNDGNLNSVSGNAFFEGLDHLNLPNGEKIVAKQGASFNLSQKSESDKLRFDVKQGALEIEDSSGEVKTLDKNTSGHYDLEAMNMTTNELDISISNNYTTWSDRTLSFNNTHLGSVFNEMEEFFGITINVKGSIPSDCHFTAPVNNANIRELFELLHESFKFRVEQEGATTFNVSKLKCQ